jgi:hypothetical protein
MNEIMKYQPKLPVLQQRQLSVQKSHMEYIAMLAVEALGEQSNVYSYTVFEVCRTLETVNLLKRAFSQNGISSETEAVLQNLTMNYLRAMEKIPVEACNMIVQVLQRASSQPDDGGLLGAVIDAFFKRLEG